MKKLSHEEITDIHKLKEEGLSGREIAEKMGISQKTVWYHLNPNIKKYVKKYVKAKIATDDEYRKRHNERCKKYARKRRKKDPQWNAKKQREYRKRHPISFNKIMARWYLRKLPKEEIKNLLEEIGYVG
jgi:IS30 family transposase